MIIQPESGKKILVIGSAVADVIITLPHLPGRREDVHVTTQKMQLGGCAFNTYSIIRHFSLPSIPFFPIGSGAYGDFVRKEFASMGIETPIPAPDADNGCCYCFVEPDGERTFLSYHGAEYRFYPEWFELIRPEEIACAYICGLEIEEPTGPHIVTWLEQHPELPVFFAPGPRLQKIEPGLAKRVLSLHPVLHLNDEEICVFTNKTDYREASRHVFGITQRAVIVTLGEKGCFFYDGVTEDIIPPVKAAAVDTIGAGDAHIGGVISALYLGKPLPEAIAIANRISSKVVSVHGALLSDADFEKILR